MINSNTHTGSAYANILNLSDTVTCQLVEYQNDACLRSIGSLASGNVQVM